MRARSRRTAKGRCDRLLLLAFAALASCGPRQASYDDAGPPLHQAKAAAAPVDTTLCIPSDVDDDGARASRASLDAFVRERMARHHREGLAASVVADGAVVWRGAYGRADRERAVPMSPDTIFPVASMSKPVMAAAVMQVVEEIARKRGTGIAEVLDDDVDALVRRDATDLLRVRHPAFPSQKITLRMILAHAAGIRSHYELVPHSVPVTAPSYELANVPDLRRAITQYLLPGGEYFKPENFANGAPGTRYEYSSVAASIAALVVEAQTKTNFADYCRDHFFVPLGMQDTAWRLKDLPGLGGEARSLAVPYTWAPGWGGGFENQRVEPSLREHVFYPSASLRTTAGDYGRFVGMLMSGGTLNGVRYLAASTVEEMLRVQFPRLDPSQGLSLYRLALGGEVLAAHNGVNEGYRSEMAFMVEKPAAADGAARHKPYGVVVLTNGDDAAPREDDMVRFVEAELLRRAAKGCLGPGAATP